MQIHNLNYPLITFTEIKAIVVKKRIPIFRVQGFF